MPAWGESVSAEHFRQALGVEPGDHAYHRRVGRPLIDQFGGLRRGVDARDVQGTLTCLRVALWKPLMDSPAGSAEYQVEVRDVDTQVQPGLLVTMAADDRDLPGPAPGCRPVVSVSMKTSPWWHRWWHRSWHRHQS